LLTSSNFENIISRYYREHKNRYICLLFACIYIYIYIYIYSEWRYRSNLSLNSALDGEGGPRHSPAALTQGKIACTNFTGNSMGSRAHLDRHRKALPHRNSILGASSPQRVAIPTELSWPSTLTPFNTIEDY